MPYWYPLHVSSRNRLRVEDKCGCLFALTQTIEQAALIVLVMNQSARRDFGDDS